MSQIAPYQNVPVQTSQNNFQSYQQPQTTVREMQTLPYNIYLGNPQEPYAQESLCQHYLTDFTMTHPTNGVPTSNLHQSQFCQNPHNVPPPYMQPQSNYSTLPQNLVDQIRSCVGSTAPIFILPGGCHQPPPPQPSSMPVAPATTLPTYTSLPTVCCPPFYPYPLPFPVYESFGTQTRDKDKSYACCQRKQGEPRSDRGFYDEEHRCTETTDDTVCSKRNCPSSLNLQALASQLLSIQGIIPCAATRLILRKIPGSNVTTSIEETMERAQRCIGALTKDQLLAESRNAQQVNVLINLHMTANPPSNIVPILTAIQLKVNLLKSQVETLINRKLMECQGVGLEVETTNLMDPMVLAMKTDAELREFLTVLRQKECDERVNMNYSPYHSQRVIAETRLNNVRNKIKQVETEFDRRRCTTLPPPMSLSCRIVQGFSDRCCSLIQPDLSCTVPASVDAVSTDSPDPFSTKWRSPRRLHLKQDVGSPETTYNPRPMLDKGNDAPCIDKKNGEDGEGKNDRADTDDRKDKKGTQSRVKKRVDAQCSSAENCSCDDDDSTSSEESILEDKKKLRLRVDETGNVSVTSARKLEDVSLMKIASNVMVEIDDAAIFRGKKDARTDEIHKDDSTMEERKIRFAEPDGTQANATSSKELQARVESLVQRGKVEAETSKKLTTTYESPEKVHPTAEERLHGESENSGKYIAKEKKKTESNKFFRSSIHLDINADELSKVDEASAAIKGKEAEGGSTGKRQDKLKAEKERGPETYEKLITGNGSSEKTHLLVKERKIENETFPEDRLEKESGKVWPEEKTSTFAQESTKQSSGSHTSYLQITLKEVNKKKKTENVKEKQETPTSTNKNDKVVSMMTKIKYDKPFNDRLPKKVSKISSPKSSNKRPLNQNILRGR